MLKIDKVLSAAREAAERQRKQHEDARSMFDRMTTAQLQELVYGDPSESRVREILASVDGLELLESG